MNINEYREGYEHGAADAARPGSEVGSLLFVLTWHPDYRKGYSDGLAGREFRPVDDEIETDLPDHEMSTSRDDDVVRESRHGGYSGYDSPQTDKPMGKGVLLTWVVVSFAITWSCVGRIIESPPYDADNLLRLPIAVVAGLVCLATLSMLIENLVKSSSEKK
jgi:hypothetical protein